MRGLMQTSHSSTPEENNGSECTKVLQVEVYIDNESGTASLCCKAICNGPSTE